MLFEFAKTEEFSPSFDIIYAPYFCDKIGYLFKFVNEHSVSPFDVLTKFVSSKIFTVALYKNDSPITINQSVIQLLEYSDCLDEIDPSIHTAIVPRYDSDIMEWTGFTFCYFFWYFSVDVVKWLKTFSLKKLYNTYYPLHECGRVVTAQKLYESYLNHLNKAAN